MKTKSIGIIGLITVVTIFIISITLELEQIQSNFIEFFLVGILLIVTVSLSQKNQKSRNSN